MSTPACTPSSHRRTRWKTNWYASPCGGGVGGEGGAGGREGGEGSAGGGGGEGGGRKGDGYGASSVAFSA